MVRLLALLIVCICFAIFMRTFWIWRLNQVRRQGKYPRDGKATMFDVRKLLMEGEKEMAVRVYCEIFKVGTQEARKAVDELERSLKT